MKNKITYVLSFDDYNDIDYHKKELGVGYCASEVAYGPRTSLEGGVGRYWGLFWKRGKKPMRKKILSMLKDNGLDLEATYYNNRRGEWQSEVYI